MQVPYNFQQVINNNQYQVINGIKCFPVSMLDENFNYLCQVVNVGSTTPTISYDGQFWFDGTILKIAQSSSWKDIKVASAVNADKLGNLLPSQFLRSDQNTTCSGNITAQQFISQITSAPPFVVNSNQLVTNLCADYVDGYHIDSTNAVTGQLVQFDTANVKIKPAPIYYNFSSGNVGIRTISPQTTLHVNSSGNTAVRVDAPDNQQCGYQWAKDGSAKWSAYIDVNSSDLKFWDEATNRVYFFNGGGVAFYGDTANKPRLSIYSVSSASYALIGLDWIIDESWIGGLYLDQQSKNMYIMQTNGGPMGNIMFFPYSTSTAEGQLSVGILDPVHGFYRDDFPSGWYGGLGVWNITCNGIYYSTLNQRSDANLKIDVQPLVDYLGTDSLDVISCLKPIKYVYVDDSLKANRFGFIAQDVSEICPELVTIDIEGKASLNYIDLIALLTRGIQELYEMLGKVIQKIGGIS